MTSRARGTLSRRRLLIGVSALGAGAALGTAGCSIGAGTGGALEFMNSYAPQDSGVEPQLIAQGEWFEAVIADWNAAHPEQVSLVYVPDYENPMNPRIATSFAAENGPDVFLVSPGEFLRYYNGGVMHDLRPYMTPEAVADFYPEALATRAVGDGIFALPMEIEPLSLYYDVAAFEDNGLSEGDLPRTWDEMMSVAQRLTTSSRFGLVLPTKPGYYQNFLFYPWIWQGGGDVVDAVTQQPVIDAPPVIAALEMFRDAVATGIAPRTPPAGDELVPAFTQGLAAMWQRGPWTIQEFALQAPEHRYGILPLPTPAGGRPVTAAGGWAWAVNNRGRDPEAAARFVVESVGSMDPPCVARMADWSSDRRPALPARASVSTAMEALPSYGDPARAAIRAQLDQARSEPRFPPVIYKALSNCIQSVQLAGGDPAAEAEQAHGAIESFLETYEGATLL